MKINQNRWRGLGVSFVEMMKRIRGYSVSCMLKYNKGQFWRQPIVLVSSAVGVIVLFVLLANLAGCFRESDEQADIGLTAEIKKGPLTISLVESGVIRNRERIIVRSEVEGARNIISLVPEGSMVKKGDLLIELDASSLEEQRLEQAARVESSEASVIQSRENLEVVRNQASADVAQAELDLRFALLELEQYENGKYPQELQQAEAAITIAGEEVQRAQDKLEWSRTLEDEGYITRSELEADTLSLKKYELDLEQAKGKLELLTKYTYVQQMEKLKSDIQQAEMALERVQRRAKADVIKAEADLRTKEYDLSHQQNRLSKLLDQIAKCRITAPSAGMVIYATSVQAHRWRRIDPLEPGQTVRERQELIHLPTDSEMMVEISVQEANLPKIRIGLPALITMETGLDRILSGRLSKIGILPDSTSMSLNPDLKLYNCDVLIDDSAEGLRQGMSCTVELMVEQYDDALYMPLQSLVRLNGVPTVYIMGPRGPEPRSVSVGLDNGRMVHVLEGLEEGDRVLLAPPLSESTRPDNQVQPEKDEEIEEQGSSKRGMADVPAESGREQVPPADASPRPRREGAPQGTRGGGQQ